MFDRDVQRDARLSRRTIRPEHAFDNRKRLVVSGSTGHPRGPRTPGARQLLEHDRNVGATLSATRRRRAALPAPKPIATAAATTTGAISTMPTQPRKRRLPASAYANG